MSTTTITTPTGTTTAQTNGNTETKTSTSYLDMYTIETVTTDAFSQQIIIMNPDTSTTRTTITMPVTEHQDTTMSTIYETMSTGLATATIASVAPTDDSDSFPFESAGPMAAGTTGGLVLLAACAYMILKRLTCNKITPLGYGR